MGLVTIISGTLCWLFVGYSLSFFGNIQYSIFYSPLASSEIVSILIQLLFCLYSVIMIIGSVLERGNWKYIVFLDYDLFTFFDVGWFYFIVIYFFFWLLKISFAS